jgi:lysophospholipase L1-like esterase
MNISHRVAKFYSQGCGNFSMAAANKNHRYRLRMTAMLRAAIVLAVLHSAPEAGARETAVRADRAAPQADRLFVPAHKELLKKSKAGRIDVCFLGDSITRRWHANDYPKFQENWKKNFFGWNAANFGWGADGTQNVLWRLQHGELDGVNPKVVVLMIGTNNVGELKPEEDHSNEVARIAAGIEAILELIREKAPRAKVALMGITPRSDKGPALSLTIDAINERIARLADGKRVRYLNINDRLAADDGTLTEGVTEDGLHLSVRGYQIWADALKPILTEWLGPPAKVDRAPPPTGIPVVKGS